MTLCYYWMCRHRRVVVVIRILVACICNVIQFLCTICCCGSAISSVRQASLLA